jgi:hypothetical protein
MRRFVTALLFIGFVIDGSPWQSNAFAGTPQVSDITDFITRLGGYLYKLPDDPKVSAEHFWVQVSYKVGSASGSSNSGGSNSGGSNSGGSNSGGSTNSSSGSSNITTITKTKFRKAAIYIATGSGVAPPPSGPPIPAPTGNFTNPTQLNFCAADVYVVETVTLDLRDLQVVTQPPEQSMDDTQAVWSVVLQTNGQQKFIRINTQTLPPNCGGGSYDSSIFQQDLDHYSIVFAQDQQQQAIQFQKLLNNAIPTLNPPVLVGATSGK